MGVPTDLHKGNTNEVCSTFLILKEGYEALSDSHTLSAITESVKQCKFEYLSSSLSNSQCDCLDCPSSNSRCHTL